MSLLCFSLIPISSLLTKNDKMLPKMLPLYFRLSIAPAPIITATKLSAYWVPSIWVMESTHQLIELNIAFPCRPASLSIIHVSMALANSEEHLVVQYSPSCKVAKHMQVCTISSNYNSLGSVQSFFPIPSIAALACGLSNISPMNIQLRWAF